jgi:hypothetical protein
MRANSFLFVLRMGIGMAYLLLYIDTMVLTASSTELLHHIIAKLKSAFTMEDMGEQHGHATQQHQLLPLLGKLCRRPPQARGHEQLQVGCHARKHQTQAICER